MSVAVDQVAPSSGAPGVLATGWRLFGKGRFLAVAAWLVMAGFGLATLGYLLMPSGGSKLEWWAAALLAGIPLTFGGLVAQAVQDVESRAFAWNIPGLWRRLRLILLGTGVLAAIVGAALHVALGGTLPWHAAFAFSAFWYAVMLADLGWVGDLRDRVMAWGPFGALFVYVVFCRETAAWLSGWPIATTVLSLAGAFAWWTVSGDPGVRRRRATTPNVYLSSLLFDEAAMRRWWIARQKPSRRGPRAWASASSSRERLRNLELGLHCVFPGALPGRWALMASLVFVVGFALVFSDGWERGGLQQGLAQVGMLCFDGGPRVGFVDRFMLVYFGAVATVYVIMTGLGCPDSLYRYLPCSRESRAALWIAMGRRLVLGYVAALLVFGLLAVAVAALLGASSWGAVPGPLLVAPAILATMPWALLGHEVLPNALVKASKGLGVGLLKVGLMILSVAFSGIVLVFLEADFANGLFVALVLAWVGDLMRARVLHRRFATQDLA